MGGSQSQERSASSTAVATPASSVGVNDDGSSHRAISGQSTTSTAEMESSSNISIPPIISSILSSSVENSPSEQQSRAREEGRGREDEEDDSMLMTFHTILARSLREVGEASQLDRGTRAGASSTPGREGEEVERSRGSRIHREHTSSRPGRHHHHHEGSTHERHGHGGERRRRRYNPEDVDPSSDPLGLELGISWAALNERLRALQGQETEEGDRQSASASSSGSGRHGSRPHRSRTTGPLFFFRASERSECILMSCEFFFFLHDLLPIETAVLAHSAVLHRQCISKSRFKYSSSTV